MKRMADVGWYCLGVLGIVACVSIVVASFVVFDAILHPSRSQGLESQVLWQLGICVQQPGDRPACVTLGTPVPEGVCNAMKQRLVVEGFPGRPVCARVLVDE